MDFDTKIKVMKLFDWSTALKRHLANFKRDCNKSFKQSSLIIEKESLEFDRHFKLIDKLHVDELLLLTVAKQFYKAADRLELQNAKDMRRKVKHLRNIWEHWEDNEQYFKDLNSPLPDGVNTGSVRWYRKNYPTFNPYSRSINGKGIIEIGHIIKLGDLKKEVDDILERAIALRQK